ncbi:transcription termination factor 1-like [Chiloscyllium plagiosum]|uniref:transcription termination factor 1-like n=1 Tax=Chiloscyllium plagiosum TaxID=36176 RepID=UPI001CB80B9B|nr:transcription termination factor 1-like [Chiloscyllium plagiosum]XP_043576269.1 transcription termination factor 1-like [Chiloscyllium plagiosum]XP_043576270.1 transcription termination factor 1-like [Chiloscyllium plagiosum]
MDTEQNLNTQLYVGNSEKKHKKKKGYSALLSKYDNLETVTVDTKHDLSDFLCVGNSKKKQKRKKNHSASLEGCDSSEIHTVDSEQDIKNLLFVDNSEKKHKKKKDCSALLLGYDHLETVPADVEQDLNHFTSVGNSGKKRKKKKDCSASLTGCDSSEIHTVDSDRDINNLLFVGKSAKKHQIKHFSDLSSGYDNVETVTAENEQDLNHFTSVSNSGKKRKEKRGHSASLGGSNSSEMHAVDSEQGLNNILFVDNSEQKHKKKKDCSALLLGYDNLETVPADTEQNLNHFMSIGNSGKKQKKKKDASASLGGCDSSEIHTVDSDQDINNLLLVDNCEKEWKHQKNKRRNSKLGNKDDDSDMQNPCKSDLGENKLQGKKKKYAVALEPCDVSETVLVDDQDLQIFQLPQSNKNKLKKRKKDRNSSIFSEECDSSDMQNLQLGGNGEKRKKNHLCGSLITEATTHMSSTEMKKEGQHSELMGNQGNQMNKLIHHSYSGETGVSVSAVKTKQILQNAGLVENGDNERDPHVTAVKTAKEITTKETPHTIRNPELLTKSKCHSHRTEERVRKNYCKSAEGSDDLETCAEAHLESAISAYVGVDTETSTKKCKRRKKKMQFENINRDVPPSGSEIPQKPIKQCKISNILSFGNYSADLLGINNKSFQKPKLSCNGSENVEKEAKVPSKAVNISGVAAITGEQIEQIVHDSSTTCEETVKTSKNYIQKRGRPLGCKNSGRPKKLTQDGTTQSPATLRRQKNKQPQQRMTELNNNASITTVENFKLEEVPVCQDKAKCSQMDKSKLTELLKDYIPNVEKLTNDTLYSIYKYDLPRFQKFKAEGISIRQGKFTEQENQQLQKNLKELMELTGIRNEWDLLHVPESVEEMLRIRRLKQNNLFCCKLAENIPRPWKCVYQRAKRMYHPHRCKGRYSKEELNKLQRLQMQYGNHWKKIAQFMERSDGSVICRAKTMKNSLKIGPWSKEEERALMNIMEQLMRKKIQEAPYSPMSTVPNSNAFISILREKLYREIPWFAVADKMEHRNWTQCRQKWMNILTTKMSGGVRPIRFHHHQSRINLIKRLYLLNIDDVGDVDWEDLCSAVGDVPPLFVQKMFYKLKVRYVPDWPKKSFGGIVDFLHDQIVPKLEEIIKKKEDQCNFNVSSDSYQSLQHEFKLSDIFDDDDDDDDEKDEIEKIDELEEMIGTSFQSQSEKPVENRPHIT